ncbi:GNAT family N-acetyltransferase [Roseiterribacter gracilis]|uniref:Acetyltransferase n=1 Tax=Roseiterribacter gracilis TaxID=2812848 RepID=A0A8S8XI23_9PROT|nr:acetyltransferase [Rhodospirillales bacterium TMPK1]
MKLRPATTDDAAAIAAIEVDNYQHVYRDHIPASWLAQQTVEKYVPWWRERLLAPVGDAEVLLALDDNGTIVGFGRSGADRHGPADGAGEFQKLYVARNTQGRGVGRALLGAMAKRLHDRGYGHARVWVLTGNQPACRFYERLGGVLVDITHEEVLDASGPAAGHVLTHVGYCWRDLAELYKLRPS